MEYLSCTNKSVLYKSPIECPECQRDYAIYEIQHECNVLASCDAPKKTYREEYIPIQEAPRKPRIACEACSNKKVEKPRRGKCPGCQFTGYYTFGADRLCPSCVVAKNSPMIKITPVKANIEIVSVLGNAGTMPIVKSPAKVFFQLKHDGLVPHHDAVTSASVMVLTDRSSTTDKFFTAVVTMSVTGSSTEGSSATGSSVTSVREFIIDLQKMLGEQRLAHDLHWQNTSTLEWEWLKFFYRKYAEPSGPTM